MHDNEALTVVVIGLFKFFKKHVKELVSSVNCCFRNKKAILFVFKDLIGVIKVNQLPPTEVGGLFLSSVVERLKADSLPKDSVL